MRYERRRETQPAGQKRILSRKVRTGLLTGLTFLQ